MSEQDKMDSAAVAVGDARILFVDDEPNVLSALRRLFRREGYDLTFSDGTEDALRVLSEQEVDLVVSDYRMPGMTGIEFLKIVREKYPDVMRVVLSGYADIETITAAINEGQIYRFISKPWNDEELKVTVRRCLESHAMARANVELSDRIREQNEELRKFNENLERKVEEKTEQLMVRNRLLELIQEIFEDLPIGVAVVDADGTIVTYNRKAAELIPASDWYPGAQSEEVLPAELVEMVNAANIDPAVEQLITVGHEGGSYLVSCQSVGQPAKAVMIAGHPTCIREVAT